VASGVLLFAESSSDAPSHLHEDVTDEAGVSDQAVVFMA
jgi:hypothetical protein